MAKWRTKPQIKEAAQWFPGKIVPGVWGQPGQPRCPCHRTGGDHELPHVTTIHGNLVHIQPGDYIVAEPDGVHYYPCKPDIWERGHERLEE